MNAIRTKHHGREDQCVDIGIPRQVWNLPLITYWCSSLCFLSLSYQIIHMRLIMCTLENWWEDLFASYLFIVSHLFTSPINYVTIENTSEFCKNEFFGWTYVSVRMCEYMCSCMCACVPEIVYMCVHVLSGQSSTSGVFTNGLFFETRVYHWPADYWFPLDVPNKWKAPTWQDRLHFVTRPPFYKLGPILRVNSNCWKNHKLFQEGTTLGTGHLQENT